MGEKQQQTGLCAKRKVNAFQSTQANIFHLLWYQHLDETAYLYFFCIHLFYEKLDTLIKFVQGNSRRYTNENKNMQNCDMVHSRRKMKMKVKEPNRMAWLFRFWTLHTWNLVKWDLMPWYQIGHKEIVNKKITNKKNRANSWNMHELKCALKLEQIFIGKGDKNFCNPVIGFVFLNKSNKHTHHGQSQLHGTIANIFHIYIW